MEARALTDDCQCGHSVKLPPATAPHHLSCGTFISLYTMRTHQEKASTSVFPLRATKLETSVLSPGRLFGSQTIAYCFPCAIDMRPTDLSQKFSRCSYSDNTCQSSQQTRDPELDFSAKAINKEHQPQFWFHPWSLLIRDGIIGPLKTPFYTTAGRHSNCQAITPNNTLLEKQLGFLHKKRT